MTRNADSEHWANVSSEWIEWARAPNHDAFWAYRDSFVVFVGRGDGEALDVGCGRVASRELRACGYRVTASDPIPALVNAAKEAQSADDYATAPGSDLPFEDARFDLVVAYNVLMGVEDVPATLKEIRRVLRPAGVLVISIVHPFPIAGASPLRTPLPPLSSKMITLTQLSHRYASDSRNAPENCGLLRPLSICGAKNHCPFRGHLALTGSTLMCWRWCSRNAGRTVGRRKSRLDHRFSLGALQSELPPPWHVWCLNRSAPYNALISSHIFSSGGKVGFELETF